MMSGEIPWFKERITIRPHDAPCSPSSEIRITQYGNSLSGVRERFYESSSTENVTGFPQYTGPDSRGRWAVTWRERREAGSANRPGFNWYYKKKT